MTFGSGDSDNFTYDPNTGRILTYGFNVNGKTDAGTLTWNSNGTLAQLAISDQITGTGDSQTCTYSYDDLQRVAGASCGTPWSQTFTYDAFGNIIKSGSLSFGPNYVFSNSATTNQFSSITGVTVRYDANGNLLTDNLNTYTWDPNWGNPASVNAINLIYDALGRVVEQQNGSTNTQILYSPVGKSALMNGQTLTKAFIYLPGGATAIYNSSGLAYYRHSDWLGSSRLTSTQARALFSSSAYAPFGEQYALTGTGADPSFTGQNSDTVSSLYDFTFRKHSPSQGRWISPDPAGISAVDAANPQTWNRYAYVGNTPLNSVDPLGLVGGIPVDPFQPLPPIDGGDGGFCDPMDPTCGGGGQCDAEFGPCPPGIIAEPLPNPRPPISEGGSNIFPGENSINFPLGSGNPLADLWQGLNLPTLPCASQFGPWCDPSMLPNPWILDAEPGVANTFPCLAGAGPLQVGQSRCGDPNVQPQEPSTFLHPSKKVCSAINKKAKVDALIAGTSAATGFLFPITAIVAEPVAAGEGLFAVGEEAYMAFFCE